jgi:hypothetical protein
MWFFRKFRGPRIPGREVLEGELFQRAAASLPVLAGLNAAELERLGSLVARFLQEKSLEPVDGLALSGMQRAVLAAQACLPVLNLGLDWYRGWSAVIVYPGEFVPQHEEVDEAGVVHLRHEPRSGESWERGPVILSWSDVEASGQRHGYNVVIHEMAHKIDMLNGDPNGFPPLHRDMRVKDWTRSFEAAFADLNRRLETGEETAIDDYAAEDPGECFAVFSEYFFELPHLLRREYPDVYAQLALFYRQDPTARLGELSF